ncbi:MAG: NAD(P)-dependent oxidoreductase [Nitrospiraceae bacterium]|nr:NAD(P)-dependent oxidoreductase [Nitrospiraceae bacterium]
MKIGFIGMGIMGSRMAANLLKKGHELVVYNRTKDKAKALLDQGASWAETPAELGSRVNIVFTMLSRPDAVAEVALLGKHSFLETLLPNSLWVDCSTVNPSFSQLMANEAKARRVRFLDAPVAGSKGPAEQAQLLFYVGGDKADVDAARPFLESMGKAVFPMGGHGMGSAMKMVNNILLGEVMVSFTEALAFGESVGLTKQAIFDTLAASPVMAPFLNFKRKKFEADDYSVEFPLRWMHKDLHLATETAFETGAALPGMSAAKELYALAMREGFGDEDFIAVYKLLSGKKT